jgi:hypothetical protein
MRISLGNFASTLVIKFNIKKGLKGRPMQTTRAKP